MRAAFAILLAFSLLAPTALAQSPGDAVETAPLAAAQWQEDLDALVRLVDSRHKAPYHAISRDEFRAAAADLRARIPGMARHEVIVGFMRLAASIGDGHTNVSPLKDERIGLRELPVKFHLFEDGLFVRAAAPAFAHLVGARVEAFDGVPVDEALRRVADISPWDNAMGARFHAPIFLGFPGMQHALGLAPDAETARLTLARDGRREVVEIAADTTPARWPPDTDISLVTPGGYADGRSGPPPLWLAAPLEYHRLVPLPDAGALYVQLNMVTGIDGQSLGDFGERILEVVARDNPRAVVLDLRLNRGGNQDLRFPFVADLVRATDDDTRLFVLVGRGSFSATQKLIGDLALYADAVLVGEPAGSRPDAYGDSYRETLPNSGITLRVSTRWHQDELHDGDWTPIDLWAPLAYADYVAGRDPALEAALAYVPPDPLWQQALRHADDPRAAAAVAQAYLDVPAHRYADRPRALVQASHRLLAQGKAEASLAIAGLGATQFPDSVRLWTMVAHAADAAGDPSRARDAAQQAIRLDPDNRDVKRFLPPGVPRPVPAAPAG